MGRKKVNWIFNRKPNNQHDIPSQQNRHTLHKGLTFPPVWWSMTTKSAGVLVELSLPPALVAKNIKHFFSPCCTHISLSSIPLLHWWFIHCQQPVNITGHQWSLWLQAQLSIHSTQKTAKSQTDFLWSSNICAATWEFPYFIWKEELAWVRTVRSGDLGCNKCSKMLYCGCGLEHFWSLFSEHCLYSWRVRLVRVYCDYQVTGLKIPFNTGFAVS